MPVLERARKEIAEELKFLPIGMPDISDLEIEEVVKVLRSGWIGTGPVTRKFEEEFSRFMGQGYVVALSSCTMGLMLALRVSNIGQGTEVITTPLTFAATVNAIMAMGAKPVFVDVDSYGCLDPEQIRFKVTDKTKGIIPVHYTGSACDMGRIMVNAGQYGLIVIEDAAHGLGGEYVEKRSGDTVFVHRKLGTLGDFGVFSFYANKNITTGEGGMLLTRRGDMAEKVRILSQQGLNNGAWVRYGQSQVASYEVLYDGYKGNLPDLLSALGLAQLQRWDELREKRAKIWKIYCDELGMKESGHSMHLYTIQVKNRDFLRQKLVEMGIGTGIHYKNLHLEPAYKSLGYKEGDFPMAEKISKETLSLPLSSKMREEDAWRVVNAVKILKEAI